MEGTKPHQQLKEVSLEERYGVCKGCLRLPYLTANLSELDYIFFALELMPK